MTLWSQMPASRQKLYSKIIKISISYKNSSLGMRVASLIKNWIFVDLESLRIGEMIGRKFLTVCKEE